MRDMLDRILTDPLTGADVRALREYLELSRTEFGEAIGAPVQTTERTDGRTQLSCRTVEQWERKYADRPLSSYEYVLAIREFARERLG